MISLKIETKTNDYKSAVVLIEEALSQIRNGSLAGIIGGNMGECMFSIDEIAAQQTLIPDVEACTAKQYHDDFAEDHLVAMLIKKRCRRNMAFNSY